MKDVKVTPTKPKNVNFSGAMDSRQSTADKRVVSRGSVKR